jgi:outer membrane lipoprotein-sorting protein
MPDFKFSCPHCDQHMLVDDGYAGIQINCPACQKLILVPSVPAAAKPPAPSPALGIRRPADAAASSPAAPAASRTAYRPPPAEKSGSRGLRTALVVSAIVIGCAALGAAGWYGYSKFKGHKAAVEAKNGNPAAQVAAPTAAETVQALSILTKVQAAYTNTTTATGDGTFTMFLDISNITTADMNPETPAGAKNADKHPMGMPRIVTNMTELTFKRGQSNWYYMSGESVTKMDRMTVSNTIAYWSSDKGKFTFSDSHMQGMPATSTYMQLPDAMPGSDPSAQIKQMQQLFADPANLTKIIKDLGQTDDESVNGQQCYTLTAKVLGQKFKVWVDKTSYLVWQWQITLGGKISDADVDDAVSLFADAVTNVPPAQLEMAKSEIKKRTPAMAKVRGILTFTCNNIVQNPALSAGDFNYPVPAGVRLIRMPTGAAGGNAAVARANSQRNACINNLRQIDAAKNQWALENRKTSGTPVTEADIKPYIKLDANGNLPKCPSGGKYTIGKVGETPTCSIPGHVLP